MTLQPPDPFVISQDINFQTARIDAQLEDILALQQSH